MPSGFFRRRSRTFLRALGVCSPSPSSQDRSWWTVLFQACPRPLVFHFVRCCRARSRLQRRAFRSGAQVFPSSDRLGLSCDSGPTITPSPQGGASALPPAFVHVFPAAGIATPPRASVRSPATPAEDCSALAVVSATVLHSAVRCA